MIIENWFIGIFAGLLLGIGISWYLGLIAFFSWSCMCLCAEIITKLRERKISKKNDRN